MVKRVQTAADAPGLRAQPRRQPVDSVVTHHRDGFRSGVARFNELLAAHLGVPVLGLEALTSPTSCPLVSFKVRELGPSDGGAVERFLRLSSCWEVYLHEYVGLPLERELVVRARRVLCGNLEIESAVRELNARVETVWTPGLISDTRVIERTELSVFSFGMAHKIQTGMFRRLKGLLESCGCTYTLFVSAANHETASLRDAEAVFEEMHALFPDRLFFLGNLSDVAVFNQLRAATYYAAFFPSGVRGNNTSVASAMEHGSVVLTNLDRHSPLELRHMENVVDVNRCEALPTDPDLLRRIGEAARATARTRDWQALVARIHS